MKQETEYRSVCLFKDISGSCQRQLDGLCLGYREAYFPLLRAGTVVHRHWLGVGFEGVWKRRKTEMDGNTYSTYTLERYRYMREMSNSKISQ